MRNATRLVGAAAGLALLVTAAAAFAQDWPQWRGANRDGKALKFTAPQTWPKELTQKWKVNIGNGDSTPALVGDKIYAFTRQGDEEVTLCLDAATGKEIWRDKYKTAAVTGAAGSHPGPRSSPAVANGKVCTFGVNGTVSCLDATTGKLLWRKDDFPGQIPQFATSMSPLIVDKLCIAHVGGKGSGAVVAYDLATGSAKWKWTGDGPAYASPALMTVGTVKQVVVQTEKNLVGLSLADGKLLWQVPTPVQGRFYNSATPIIDGQTVYFTGQGQGTKAIRVEKKDAGFVAKDLWSNPDLGTGYNTPVLKDGLLYGINEKGFLFCLDAKTGKTAWSDSANKLNNFGEIVDAGNVLLALPSTSELLVYKPSSKEFAQVARMKVAETPTYSYPVVSGNRIFIKDQDNLTLLTVQ